MMNPLVGNYRRQSAIFMKYIGTGWQEYWIFLVVSFGVALFGVWIGDWVDSGWLDCILSRWVGGPCGMSVY